MTLTAAPPAAKTYAPLDLFDINRLLDEDEARRAAWHAGHAQASALRQSLRALMDQGLERIAPETLDKLLVQATARGTGNPYCTRRPERKPVSPTRRR